MGRGIGAMTLPPLPGDTPISHSYTRTEYNKGHFSCSGRKITGSTVLSVPVLNDTEYVTRSTVHSNSNDNISAYRMIA